MLIIKMRTTSDILVTWVWLLASSFNAKPSLMKCALFGFTMFTMRGCDENGESGHGQNVFCSLVLLHSVSVLSCFSRMFVVVCIVLLLLSMK